MKITNLNQLGSEKAPKDWEKIPEILAQYPKGKNIERSLQKLDGFNICVWMTCRDGVWQKESDFFHIKI